MLRNIYIFAITAFLTMLSLALQAPRIMAQPRPTAAPDAPSKSSASEKAPSLEQHANKASERERAALAFQEALLAFQNGDFETARQRYQEAYELLPHPNTLYNLALACERLLDYDGAMVAFRRFLKEPLPSDLAAAHLQQTRRLLAERSLRRLSSLPARVSVSAVPDPVTAQMEAIGVVAKELDKEAVAAPPGGTAEVTSCQTPCIFTVPAGHYRLSMHRDGYFDEQVEFETHVGQAMLISRQLRARPRLVELTSQPRARLYLDDRLLGETPYRGEIGLGNHRLRLERRFYLTQLRPLDLGPGAPSTPLHFHIGLELSGRMDMLIGGAVAGAALGLMVLRLFVGDEIETLPREGIYKPLAAATLPAILGASVAGFAGWEMPQSQAQLLIGSAGWGALIGFGLGLGSQPKGALPHVLAVGSGLIGGTIGTAVYRFLQPSSGATAIFNSTTLWSTLLGALGWAYLISDRPQTAFYGQSSADRTGEGGWIVFATALSGVGLGIGLAHLPVARELSRAQVALLDLGGLLGGLTVGGLGMGIGYLRSGSWNETAHIAVPCAIAGLGAGLFGAAILVNHYRQHQRFSNSAAGRLLPLRALQSGRPQLQIGQDLRGGVSLGIGIFDGSF